MMAEIRCDKCDDSFIKMFFKDHVCDPNRLAKMVVNSRGQRAEMIGQESKDETFECEICKEKFKDIAAFSDHLQAHEIRQMEE